jgi:hypothetical protein
MESLFPVFNEILPYVPHESRIAFSLTSQHNYKVVKYQETNSDYWKRCLEEFLNIELPNTFIPTVGKALKYYKTLYLNVYSTDLTDNINHLTINTSRYEYVWLKVNVLGSTHKDDVFGSTSIYGMRSAIQKYHNSTLLLLLNSKENRDTLAKSTIPYILLLACALVSNNIEAFKIILDLVTDTESLVSIVRDVINHGRVELLKLLINKDPKCMQEHHVVYSMSCNLKNRVQILELYLLSNPFPVDLSLYFQNNILKVTHKEMMLLLESPAFVKDSVRGIYPAKTAQYILENFNIRADDLVHVYKNLMYSNSLFERALIQKTGTFTDKFIKKLYKSAVSVGKKSLLLLMKYYPLNREQSESLLKKCLSGYGPTPDSLAYLIDRSGLSMSYVARYMVDKGCNAILCLKAGMPVNIIGNKCLSRDNIKILKEYGYNINAVAPYFIQKRIDKEYMFYDWTILKYISLSAIDILYVTDQYIGRRLHMKLPNTEIKLISRVTSEDWWYCYSNNCNRNEVSQENWERCVRYIQYKLLTCSFNKTPDRLLDYLDQISEYSVGVTKDTNGNIIVDIGDKIITLTPHSYKGKYRSMDVFSNECKVLTTRDEIANRRKELKAQLSML